MRVVGTFVVGLGSARAMNTDWPIRVVGSVLSQEESPILAYILTEEPSQKDCFILLNGGCFQCLVVAHPAIVREVKEGEVSAIQDEVQEEPTNSAVTVSKGVDAFKAEMSCPRQVEWVCAPL